MKDLTAEIKALEDRIEETTAWDLLTYELELGRSYRILEGNCRDVDLLVDDFRAGKCYRGSILVEPEIFACANRCHHNFLASTSTLRDHYHRYRDCDAPIRVAKRCKELESRRFAGNGLAHFVTSLRNYATHRRLPIQNASVTISASQPARSSIAVAVRQLVPQRSWRKNATSAARQYAESKLRGIPIDVLAGDYLQLVTDFYSQVVELHREEYRDEFDQLSESISLIEEFTREHQARFGTENALSTYPYVVGTGFFGASRAWLDVAPDGPQ